MTFFWFLVIGFFKKRFVLFFPNENQLGFHMRYHLFLHYKWFLQNLGKDFIRTNMHTNVYLYGQKRREMRVNCLANKDKALANMVEHTISTRASPNTRICSSCLCASSCVHVQSTAYNISSTYIYIFITRQTMRWKEP